MEKSNFDTLQAAMARDWLNWQVKIHEMRKASSRFSDTVRLMEPDEGIHMQDGVFCLTELLGLDMEENVREDTLYPWKYSFLYKGVQFYQISGERLGRHAESADV